MGAKTAGRTRRVARPARATEAQEQPDAVSRMPNLPNWHWRSFPVFAAFVAGVLVDAIINPPQSDAAVVLRIIAILGAGYCLAHVFVVNTVVARRIKAREKAIAAAGSESGDEDWVDEVVHPDELPATSSAAAHTEAHITQ